jgi:hypothetical protein
MVNTISGNSMVTVLSTSYPHKTVCVRSIERMFEVPGLRIVHDYKF